MFRRLAVVLGDWTADTARAIVDPDESAGIDIFDGLASLVDKNLFRTVASDDGETRFGRHVFVREFALEQLGAAGERPACERRHAETFRDLAVALGPQLTLAGGPASLDLMDHAIHDLRQAMTWSMAAGEPEIGMRIIGSAWRWWQLRSNLREGRDWATRLLAIPPVETPSFARVEALAGAGGLAYWQTDYPATRVAYERRLTFAEQLGDRRQLAEAHYDLGFIGMVEANLDFLRQEEEMALSIFRELGDESGITRSRQALVLGYFLAGDHVAAMALEEENLAAFRATQSPYRNRRQPHADGGDPPPCRRAGDRSRDRQRCDPDARPAGRRDHGRCGRDDRDHRGGDRRR